MLGSVSMGWRQVLFANWPADPAVVAPHVPDALSLDTRDGRAWLSAVPFTNVDVRPSWLPRGAGFRLPELNLRTYVSHEGEPGVYFFALDAQGLLGVVGARLVHHLPYYYARIDLAVEGDRVRFSSRRCHPGARPVDFAATYGPSGSAGPTESGSLSAFLVERYRYYTEDRHGDLRSAEVDHEPWVLTPAEADVDPGALFRANGFDVPDADPVHYYSPGVEAVASASRRA